MTDTLRDATDALVRAATAIVNHTGILSGERPEYPYTDEWVKLESLAVPLAAAVLATNSARAALGGSVPSPSEEAVWAAREVTEKSPWGDGVPHQGALMCRWQTLTDHEVMRLRLAAAYAAQFGASSPGPSPDPTRYEHGGPPMTLRECMDAEEGGARSSGSPEET